MASKPVSKYSFNVQEFDQLEGLTDDIFGGEQCGKCKYIDFDFNTCVSL